MSEVANPARGVIPASFVVLFSMTVAGILVKQTKLDPIRPVEREAAVDVPQWDDPFLSTSKKYDQWLGATLSGRALPVWEEPGTIADLREEIEHRTAPEQGRGAAKTLSIVPVLTASGLSHNSIEVRRRQRVALSTAMVSHQFAPESPGSLKYLAAVLPGAAPGSKALVVPYEWFANPKSRESRLVLWLQGAEFERSSFGYRSAFELLVNAVLPDSFRNLSSAQTQTRVQVIGPASSGELRSLAGIGPDRSAEYTKYRRVSSDRKSELAQIRRMALMLPELEPGAADTDLATGALEKVLLDRDQIRRYYASEANLVMELAVNLYSVDQMKEQVLDYLDEEPAATKQNVLGECISELLFEAGSNERSVRSFRAIQQVSKFVATPVGETDPITNFRTCLVQLRIKDSDPVWETRVAELMRDKTSVMLAVRNQLSGNDLTNTDRIILLAEGYLDSGWSEAFQLSEGMTQTLELVCNSPRDFEQNRARLQQQLRESLPLVEDIDQDWAAHLGDLYVASCPGAAAWTANSDASSEETRPEPPEAVELNIGIRKFEFYSPLATMPDHVIFGGDPTPGVPTSHYVGVDRFMRVIATDDVVLTQLFGEFDKRHTEICSATIPLILQGDSVYGRESINSAMAATGCEDREPKIEQHFYFSHTEGSVDHESNGKSSTRDGALLTGQLPSDPGEMKEGNFPAGPHQLDYISRLADQFSQRNIQVIGIMGGDIYDKQLIIQALRQRISTAVIFTTDADAIYEYPKFFKANRNLLLASSYGLSIPLKFSRSQDGVCVPVGDEKFSTRDNYQSSFYAAAQAMLAECEVTPPFGLFEIGNSGMLRISAGNAAFDMHNLEEASYHRYLRVVFLLMPMLLLFGFSQRGVAMLKPLADECFKLQKQVYRVTSFVSLVAILVMGWALFTWNSSIREPLYLFEGISSVPTLVMRLNAMLLAIFLIAYLIARLRINNSTLESYFQLPPYSKSAGRTSASELLEGKPPRIWKWSVDLYALRHRAARLHDPLWRPPSASALWKDYMMLGSRRARLFRTLVFALPLMLLTLFFVFRIEPQPPLTRDPSNMYLVITSLSVMASILAVVMAGDALKLCTVFVNYLQFDFFHWEGRPNRESYKGLDNYVADRLCSIEMIMRRTETLRLVIILPAIVLFLQIFARSTLFEGWVWTMPLIVIYVYFISYVFFRSIRLQQAANSARAGILVDLERRKSEISKGEDSEAGTRQVEDTIKYIRSIRRGAFQPVLDHPIFQAIAWPSTALGIMALIQALL